MAEINLFDAFLGIGTMVASAALGYLGKSLTGESRATVRDINANAGSKEVATEKTAYELAQSVMNDMVKLREEYKEVTNALETEREARKKLEKRVETLEAEGKEKDKKILALEIENAELKKSLNKGNGLGMK